MVPHMESMIKKKMLLHIFEKKVAVMFKHNRNKTIFEVCDEEEKHTWSCQ